LIREVSLKQALAEQGLTGGARGDTEWSQWVRSEKEQLSQVIERHDIQWEQLGTHDEHLSVMNYKKEQRAKEVKALEKSLAKLQNQQLDVKAVEQIDVKNVPLSSKVMLEKGDYQTLVTAAQKYVVQVKKENKLQKLLDAANRKIEQLEKKVTELLKSVSGLTKQLDQFRSIRGQLDRGKLQSENTELRKQNSTFKSIIEQHGLGHLLGRNKNQRNERDAL
jgi:predicted RNase H-like nuclease (RuvC/YqgF family)